MFRHPIGNLRRTRQATLYGSFCQAKLHSSWALNIPNLLLKESFRNIFGTIHPCLCIHSWRGSERIGVRNPDPCRSASANARLYIPADHTQRILRAGTRFTAITTGGVALSCPSPFRILFGRCLSRPILAAVSMPPSLSCSQ